MARLVALGLALALPSQVEGQTRIGIELGATPEPLVMESVDGGRIDLAESIGVRPVLLQFWATWCPKCEELAPQIAVAREEFDGRVDFYGIAVAVGQSPRSVRRHLEDHPLPFPTLWDEGGAATRRFMAPTTSYIVILDADGRVAYTGVDVDQDIPAELRRIVGSPELAPQSASDAEG